MLLRHRRHDGRGEHRRTRRRRQDERGARPGCACAAWSRSCRGRGPTVRHASPTSTCIINAMSRDALASAPTTRAQSCARAATRTRCVNQGPGGSASFRCLASTFITGSASATQCRQASRGAAELHDLRFRQALREPTLGAIDVGSPAGDLLPQRQRRCRLQQGAAQHRRRAVLLGEPREGRDDAVERLQQRRQRLAELQHHRRVDHVLTGGAPMDIVGGLGIALAHLLGQRLHDRHGERRRAARGGNHRRGIVERRIAGLDDDRRGALRDQAGRRGRFGKRRLEAQHVAQGGGVGEAIGGRRR